MARVARLLPVVLSVAACWPAAGRAQISPEGATQLEQQLHDWVAGLAGPLVTIPPLPLHILAEGDHYRAETDIGGLAGAGGYKVGPGSLVATFHPLDGTRWSLDSLRVPSPLALTDPAAKGPAPRDMTLTIGQQDVHGVLDTTLATASSLDTAWRDYVATTQPAKGGKQVTRTEMYITHTVLRPAADGRIDVNSDLTMTNLSTEQVVPEAGRVSTAIARVTGTVKFAGVSPDRVGPIVQGGIALVQGLDAARPVPGGKGLPEPLRSTAGDTVRAVGGLLTGLYEDVTLEGFRFTAAGHGGGAAKVVFGLGLDAPQGRTALRLHLALDGLDSPEIPPGAIHDLVPRHISLTPRISGIPADDILQFITHAIVVAGTDSAELQGEAIGLLAKGPLEIGIEELALDVGPATLHAVGAVEIPAPDTISGKAEVAATGLDALIKRATSTRELKTGAPVLLFLKGIGEQTGDATVWRISYDDHKLTVNGTDMSQMIPGK